MDKLNHDMIHLSPHFTLHELTASGIASRDGLDNRLDLEKPRDIEVLDNLRRLAANVLEPLRVALGSPVFISSGYRSPEVNVAAKGSKTSDHMRGCAADLEAPPMSNLKLARFIRAIPGLVFDQLILEFHVDGDAASGWVHVSHRLASNRREVITARRGAKGETLYAPGLPGDLQRGASL